jgi:hypothetical protein
MKKIILTITVVMVVTFVNAQDKRSSSNEIEFGLKGGLNFSNFSGDGSPTMKVGINLGFFGEYKVNEKFAIQPELLYSTQGTNLKYYYEESTETYDFELAYINIPIMAKYYVSEKFSLYAGPQFGFLLSANVDYYYEDIDGSFEGSEDNKKYFNSIDYGLNLGVGYCINNKLALDLRYNIGLNDVEKNSDLGVSGHSNKVIQLSFGYKF